MPDQTTVMFTSGVGGAAYDWDLVAPLLPPRYRVVRFERPGLDGLATPRGLTSAHGTAGSPSGLPTLEEEADRLAVAADRYGGAIVVAHSASALHAEAMGRMHPHALQGLVLLDPSYGSAAPEGGNPSSIGETLSRHASRVLAPVGPALWATVASTQTVGTVPQSVRAAARERLRCPIAFGAAWQEYLAFNSMLRDLAALRKTPSFPSVPVWILTATGGMPKSGAVQWMRYHDQLATLLEARHRILPHSRHYVAWDDPQLVTRTIESVAEESR